jgi:hypothetical protein
VDERQLPHRSTRRDPSRAQGGKLAPDTDDFRVMREKIEALLAEDPKPSAVGGTRTAAALPADVHGEAVHACQLACSIRGVRLKSPSHQYPAFRLVALQLHA